MPAPIVLRTLTPEVKKVDNPPAGQPVIATKAELRDGSRPGSGGGGDPIDPVDPGAIDWTSRLSRAGSGTPDSSFNPETDIVYQGAFRIPYFSNSSGSARDKISIVFKPAEAGGRNGANGSLFMAGPDVNTSSAVAEVGIPALSMDSNHLNLNAAPVIQNWVSVYSKAPNPDTNGSDRPAAMVISGDKLYMAMHRFYDTDGNSDNLLICNDAKDLANASYQGFLSRDGEDLGSKYSCAIPPEHQSTFGATHFSGVFASHSIITRSSRGPALIGWNPDQVQLGDTTVPATVWTNYQVGTEIEFWDYDHAAVTAHYENEIGVSDLQSWLNSDPTTRVTSFDSFTLPDSSIYGVGGCHDTFVQCAFIPPNTDTLVLIGYQPGTRYGLGYKGKTIENGNTQQDSDGFYPYSVYDWDHRYWTMNLGDISSAANAYEPGFIRTGIFDNNRWLQTGGSSAKGKAVGGCFDPGTGRLFVLHNELSFSEFETQYVVSVYQVNS